MNHRLYSNVAAALAAIATIAVWTGSGRAQAMVTQDATCLVFDSTCSTLFSIQGDAVVTDSLNGVVTCQGTLIDATPYVSGDVPLLPSPGANHCENFACATPLGPTYDSKETITPTGQVNLQCKINGSNQ